GASLPICGALPPAWVVEKNTGSTRSKSRSSRMRCTRTEPTIPRQPTMPTLTTLFLECSQCRDDCRAHFPRPHHLPARLVDIGGPQALLEHPLHRDFDPVGGGALVQR